MSLSAVVPLDKQLRINQSENMCASESSATKYKMICFEQVSKQNHGAVHSSRKASKQRSPRGLGLELVVQLWESPSNSGPSEPE